jgi:dihydropteroate synthase
MGIINMTPDSFSQDGCLHLSKDPVPHGLRMAKRFVRQGADILDIGGESSRPGAKRISDQEELQRILPLLKKLIRDLPIPISVDTYKSTVARHALDHGASIINTIKGTRPEKSLLRMIKRYGAAVVLMHMVGTPPTMQKNIRHQRILDDVIRALRNSIEICLESGVTSDKIIIDPGIGFGKTWEHNLEIINHLPELASLNQPILIGTSRKSFIGKVLDKDTSHRLLGTAASVCASIIRGAHIVRVHDVKAMAEIATMTDAIINQETSVSI